jgi:hypothetical protein
MRLQERSQEKHVVSWPQIEKDHHECLISRMWEMGKGKDVSINIGKYVVNSCGGGLKTPVSWKKRKGGRGPTVRNKKWPPAPSVPPTHSTTHAQRAGGNTPKGKHTGTHSPGQGAGKQPRLSLSECWENLLFTAPSSPLPQRGVGNLLYGTHIQLIPVCCGTVLKQFKYLVGSIQRN